MGWLQTKYINWYLVKNDIESNVKVLEGIIKTFNTVEHLPC